MVRSSRAGLGLAALLALSGPVASADAAETREYARLEVGIEAGFFLPDEDLSNKDTDLHELEPTSGLRFGWLFAPHFDWFVDSTFADFNTNTLAGDVETATHRTGVSYYFRPHGKKVQWFVAGGGGIVDYREELLDDFDRQFASLSVGQKVRLDRRANFRWEVRADQAFDDDDVLDGEDITTVQFLIGVHFGLGRIDRDSDGDGVVDRLDECPNTPHCAIVDERGCPKDSDGDGVWDGCDKCPDTPRCAVVDEQGCPKDSDGDGVWDGCDKCPDTPSCAVVDEQGCPKDSDGDGVSDGCDKCPDTPRCAGVDPEGCPKDSDRDSVPDGCDLCPGTEAGVPVRPDGCPKEAALFTEDKKKLILEGVFFEFDRAVLLPESAVTLDRVARSLLDWPDVRVEIEGHTDSDGPDDYNLRLSDRRARAVLDYLVNKGVPRARLDSRGYGESRPLVDNRTAAGRARNRRVELRKLD